MRIINFLNSSPPRISSLSGVGFYKKDNLGFVINNGKPHLNINGILKDLNSTEIDID